jgi:hypothetical protein
MFSTFPQLQLKPSKKPIKPVGYPILAIQNLRFLIKTIAIEPKIKPAY